jgi:hypothetical protein
MARLSMIQVRLGIRFAEAGKIRGINRAIGGNFGQESREAPARALAGMQANEGDSLVEPTGGRERRAHVELAKSAIEIGAARAHRGLWYGG